MRPLDALRAQTTLVALAPHGYVATSNPGLEAYQTMTAATREELEPLRPELLEIARAGAPAARVYAALLVRQLDETLARTLLESMRGTEAECTLAPGGCIMVGDTLDEVASYLLGCEPSPTIVEPRRLREAVASHASAPGYGPPNAGPLRSGRNGWAEGFARLLQREDLELARAEIEELAANERLPGALYGAVLLARIDPARGRARMIELAARTEVVRVLEGDIHDSPVSALARAWLSNMPAPIVG